MKIGLVGTMSVGKTTLAKALGETDATGNTMKHQKTPDVKNLNILFCLTIQS